MQPYSALYPFTLGSRRYLFAGCMPLEANFAKPISNLTTDRYLIRKLPNRELKMREKNHFSNELCLISGYHQFVHVLIK